MAKKIEVPKGIELMHKALFSKKEKLKMIPDLKVKSILIQNEIIEKGNKENKKMSDKNYIISIAMMLFALFSLIFTYITTIESGANKEKLEKLSLQMQLQKKTIDKLSQAEEDLKTQLSVLRSKVDLNISTEN
jgi:hypothetical protein